MNPFGHVWDIVVPDDRRDLEQAIFFSVLTGGVSLGTWAYAVVHNVPRMAAHHLPDDYVRGQLSRTLLRRSARQTAMGSIARGVSILARANPAVALTLTALEVAYMIPPSGDEWDDVMASNPQWSVNPFTGEFNPHHYG